MRHQRECLAFGLEARQYLLRVHSKLDDLQGNASLDRLLLFGEVHHSHAAFAEHLQKAIRSDSL
jgi:hypothetical protein